MSNISDDDRRRAAEEAERQMREAEKASAKAINDEADRRQAGGR